MTYQRRSSLYHLGAVPRQIWRHPNNRGRRLRRLVGSVFFQLRKRLGLAPATLPLVGDLRVIADTGAGGVSNLVYFGSYFEYDELRFCERYLRPGDHVVDGGANIGLVSLLLCRWVGDQGSVTAFEPAPTAARQMRGNLELNRVANVELIEAALGAHDGTTQLIADMDVSNQLVREAPGDHAVETVRVVRLEEVLEDRAYALVKLDLEGAELDALRGAEALLAADRLPVLLLEAYDHQLLRLGGSRVEVLELLEAHGYRFAEFDADSNRLTFAERPAGDDFLAIHSGSEPTVERRLADSG